MLPFWRLALGAGAGSLIMAGLSQLTGYNNGYELLVSGLLLTYGLVGATE